MNISIASARPHDEDFLWTMIYYAAHMEQDGATSLYAAKDHPYLKRYVAAWGAPNDMGVIGYNGSKPIGAVWSRLLIGDRKTYAYVDDYTPELAAAVLPEYIGKGVGTKLLRDYLNKVKDLYPAVTLIVRVDNPAFRLYQREGFTIKGEVTNRIGTKSYHMIIHFDGNT